METIRLVNGFGLFKLTSGNMYRIMLGNNYSYWFYDEEKNELLEKSDDDFVQSCKEILEMSQEVL